MGMVSRFFWGFGRLLAYPVIRPMETIVASSRRISSDVRDYRELRARRRAELDEASAQEGADLAAMSDRDRFESLVVMNGWTPAELARQLLAVRRTKLMAICGSVAGTVLAMASMFLVPVWILFVIAPAAALFVIMGLIRTLQFGLFQAQLEQRRLMKFHVYLGRQDLFKHLIS